MAVIGRPPPHDGLQFQAGDGHVGLRVPVAVDDDQRDLLAGVVRALGVRRFLGALLETLPTELLHVGENVNLFVLRLGPGEQVLGIAELLGQLGALVADGRLVDRLEHLVVGGLQPLLVVQLGAPGEHQHDLVAVPQFAEDLPRGVAGGLEAGAPLVDHPHAGRVVEKDRHGRGAIAPEMAQARQRRLGQPERQENQHRHAQKHQQEIVNPFPPRVFSARSAGSGAC